MSCDVRYNILSPFVIFLTLYSRPRKKVLQVMIFKLFFLYSMANDEDDDQKDTNSFHMIARMQIIASCLQCDMVNKFLCISSTLHYFSFFFGKSSPQTISCSWRVHMYLYIQCRHQLVLFILVNAKVGYSWLRKKLKHHTSTFHFTILSLILLSLLQTTKQILQQKELTKKKYISPQNAIKV